MAGILDSATPLFIIGPPRTGTTLLARILNAHPLVLVTNETAVFLFFCESIRRSKIGVRAGILWGKDYHDLWSKHLEKAVQPMIRSYYEEIASLEHRERLVYWGDKHPHHDVCIPFLAEQYPRCRFIYTQRDPRDSICSICEMNGWPFAKALETWRRMSERYEKELAQFTSDRVYRIVYESVVSHSVREIEALLGWLGLEMDVGVHEALEHYRTRDAHERIQSRVDFKKKSVGRWRRELTPEDRVLALQEIGKYLDEYGYPRN
ncbi:MAG: sulfotransferase [Acidobacteria bacterium]|nr:sulfotransferase [Acidobacteriota bacterium]